VKLTPVALPPAGTSELIVSIVHTASILIAVASITVAGKATDIAIRLHNSKREESVRPESTGVSEEELGGSAKAGKRPPTCLKSESSTISEPTFASCRVQVSPTPSPLDESIPTPSVFLALNRIASRVGLGTAGLQFYEGEVCHSRTNSGNSNDSYSEACHPIAISCPGLQELPVHADCVVLPV